MSEPETDFAHSVVGLAMDEFGGPPVRAKVTNTNTSLNCRDLE